MLDARAVFACRCEEILLEEIVAAIAAGDRGYGGSGNGCGHRLCGRDHGEAPGTPGDAGGASQPERCRYRRR